MNKPRKMNILINWCFFLYIAILFGERLQSLISSSLLGVDFFFASFFRGFTNISVIVSLSCTILLLIFLNRDFMAALFTNKEVDYKNLSLTTGVILVSGMFHTEFTILAIQFVAYGFLILALIFETILNQAKSKHKSLSWLSLIYLIAFSMAIPVVYETSLDGSYLFHSLEIVISLILIAAFVYMEGKIFSGEGEHLFYYSPMLFALLGDLFIIIFRWNELINWFLLIALITTFSLFIIGKIIEGHFKRLDKKK